VKTYELGDDGLEMVQDGTWVLYSDHLKEVEVLREALREARGYAIAQARLPWKLVEKIEKLLGISDPTS
jgi:hypothetical protein